MFFFNTISSQFLLPRAHNPVPPRFPPGLTTSIIYYNSSTLESAFSLLSLGSSAFFSSSRANNTDIRNCGQRDKYYECIRPYVDGPKTISIQQQLLMSYITCLYVFFVMYLCNLWCQGMVMGWLPAAAAAEGGGRAPLQVAAVQDLRRLRHNTGSHRGTSFSNDSSPQETSPLTARLDIIKVLDPLD